MLLWLDDSGPSSWADIFWAGCTSRVSRGGLDGGQITREGLADGSLGAAPCFLWFRRLAQPPSCGGVRAQMQQGRDPHRGTKATAHIAFVIKSQDQVRCKV